MSTPLDADPILVEVRRGDLVETVHRGRLVVIAPDGSTRVGLGSVDEPMYPRSSIKPLQAIAMLEAGLDTRGSELALAAASHRGEHFHLAGVLTILAEVGLSVDDLQNTPDLPLADEARAAWLRAGRDAEPLTQNCSGKHASMLRTCVRAGWPTVTYREPDHPLQRLIRRTIAAWCGAASDVTVDGCGAPLFAVPLSGLARAFGAIAAATDGPARLIADAYRGHPEYPSGTGTAEEALHRAVPGLICKGGAEGCLAIGLADGTGIAIKSDDGSHRGQFAVAAEVLVRLGVAATRAALAGIPHDQVLGHGLPVGEVRPQPATLGRGTGPLAPARLSPRLPWAGGWRARCSPPSRTAPPRCSRPSASAGSRGVPPGSVAPDPGAARLPVRARPRPRRRRLRQFPRRAADTAAVPRGVGGGFRGGGHRGAGGGRPARAIARPRDRRARPGWRSGSCCSR